jgi:hypothetical protein
MSEHLSLAQQAQALEGQAPERRFTPPAMQMSADTITRARRTPRLVVPVSPPAR